MIGQPRNDDASDTEPVPAVEPMPGAPPMPAVPAEVGGRDGPEPTRYGDWEKNGRCIDF